MEKYKYNDNQHPQFSTKNDNWFTNVFGFEEGGMKGTDIKDMTKIKDFLSPVNQNLKVNSSDLKNVSIFGNGKTYNVGKVKFLSTDSLLQSITKVETAVTDKGNGLKYYVINGNAGPLHYDPQLKGSLFQAASQFNALEMSSPDYIPEQGITIYKDDKTQGPACALACPYATLYRNYFSMQGDKLQSGIRDSSNNTSDQINALEEFEKASSFNLRKENGYFYPNDATEAKKINDYLSNPENFWNSVKLVKYFIHEDTPVVSAINGYVVQNVAQIYCSALPLAYKRNELNDCPLFIKMILCAIYYATFAQAVVMAQTKNDRVKVLITGVGGGVFGNSHEVIDAAINSALTFFKDYPIDVYYVVFNPNVTEFINPTTELPYPGDKGEKITPPPSFQVGGAPPSRDSPGNANPPMSGKSTPPPSTPSCKIDPATQAIKNITTECQEDIFSLVAKPVISSPSSDEPKDMSNLVSAIGTDYLNIYATEQIMPPGSATLLYIGDTDLYSIKQSSSDSTWSPDSKTDTKIKYMIHASPANSGRDAKYITKDTISNSVMNSLILAAKNGVKKIIFPFIGGDIFYGALKTKVDKENSSKTGYIQYNKTQHAEVLVKGVTDFYSKLSSSGITSNPFQKIYFLTYNDGNNDEETGMQQAIIKAISINGHLKDVLEQKIKGTLISNVIPPYGVKNIDAIVNAGNTNHDFATGSGVADMCFAALNDNSSYQKKLDTIKTNFIEAFTKYITDPSAASSPPPKSSTKTKEDLVKVIEGLVNSIKETEDDYTKTLGIKSSNGDLVYQYPPSDASLPPLPKKNLNSADPAIKDMIEAFETAADGGETNFYLGACRSIQAAYVLEKGSSADTTPEAMRAKLLLNLRKNSLLLKVPKGWDYAEMKMGVEPEPVMEPPFSVPLANESGVFCFENVSFQLLFSIDSVRKFSEKPIEQIDATTLCKTLTINSDIPKCEGVFENTYNVLHKMSKQYKKNKLTPVEDATSKKKLEEIKNVEVTEVYTQADGSQQADAADFLVYTILPYLILYEPISNSICFKQYELTLCNNDIDDTEIKRLNVYKFDITKYEQDVGNIKKTYDFSKNSVLQKIGVKIDNKKLLDILNPVGVEQTALMCFTDGNSIQECINDYLIAKDLVKNDDKDTETGQYQNELAQNSTCSKDNTIKRPVLYIPETQKYLIVILKRYTLKEGKTSIVDKNINVDEKITINKDIEYVNEYEFKLRGVICKTGSAGGGHYVYISYEDDKKILYNDSAPPADFNSGYNMNKQGYVFLYEKVISQIGGSNNIPRSITYTNAAITNHSKSKHNSSFKVSSSSKSKGKSHNRSHTQRVK